MAAAQPFCFVDEIEVWRGPDAWRQGDLEGQKAADPKTFYQQARIRSGVSARLVMITGQEAPQMVLAMVFPAI